ncbi:MAG: hypothetical protein ABI661_06835, partial [Gammaproteobacteria bacterium]
LGADAEDYLATWRLFVERQGAPKLLLVGLDMDAFAKDDRSVQFSHTLPFLSAYNGTRPSRLKWIRHTLRMVQGAISAGYVKDAAVAFWSFFSPPEVRFAFRPDGVLLYPKADREMAVPGTNRQPAIDQCTASYTKRLAAVDPARWSAVERVIREANAAHTRVILWITPLHPTLLQAIESDSVDAALLRAFHSLADSMSRRAHVDLVDLSRPESWGGDPGDWYDCVHFRRENARRIEAAIAAHTAPAGPSPNGTP